ncbi:MAG TPA: hypothetical protein VGM79_30435 [Streptosporangiaceae bacterium]
MLDDWSRPVSDGPDDDDRLTDARPDLGPLQEAAERDELAGAVACLAGSSGFRLRADDPVAPLARKVAWALTLAGFTLHHCVQSDPLDRLGGVCLLPVAAGPDSMDCGGLVVSWTTHKLLSLDWDRWSEHQGTHAAMNRALAEVLDALGFRVRPFGHGGASLVTGQRAGDNRHGAGR